MIRKRTIPFLYLKGNSGSNKIIETDISTTTDTIVNLIPQPQKIIDNPGCFNLDKDVAIVVSKDNDEYPHILERLKNGINKLTGNNLSDVQPDRAEGKCIRLQVSSESSDSESYRLVINKENVVIDGDTPIGLFWGTQTLLQIIRLHGQSLPYCEIVDSPDFPHRGFYHDVTRGKVPTLATLKLLADKLVFYKINQLQLYVEHTFAFRSIPELWQDKDPLTADEIRELDDYCRRNFIDLVPSLATFGHLYELLRIKRFEHLNELGIKASQVPHNLWDRMAHYTIDVSQEESFRLIKSMIDEFVPLFSSRYCNICCDETFDLGKGKNQRRAAEVGRGRLYLDFVKKVMGAVRDHGKSPMLWGDIILHYPELIGELPKDTVFLNWGYGADVTVDATKAFADAVVTQYVCPGVQGWSRFANEINIASSNIRKMVYYGKKYHAVGVLNTDWGDCGHVNFIANSFHGMALGAALSWNTASYTDDDSFDTAVSAMEWGDSSGAVAKLLRELGSLCFYHFGNMYAWVNGLKGIWDKEIEVQRTPCSIIAQHYARSLEILNAFIALKSLKTFTGEPQDLEEFICGARAISWTFALLAFKKRITYGQKKCPAVYGNKKHLLEEGAKLVEEFELLWRKRNKKSELRNVTKTFQKMFIKIGKMPDG